MNVPIIKTTLPPRVIIQRAEEILKANRVASLWAPVTVTPEGLLTVRSIYLPWSGTWLATELIADLGLSL
jgi:hypothetical protein